MLKFDLHGKVGKLQVGLKQPYRKSDKPSASIRVGMHSQTEADLLGND